MDHCLHNTTRETRLQDAVALWGIPFLGVSFYVVGASTDFAPAAGEAVGSPVAGAFVFREGGH